MFYVYILKSIRENATKLYKGYTEDLRKRLKEHNSGKIRSTKGLRPWKIVYYEVFNNKKDALREEKFLKTGKGKERIHLLLKNSLI